ncbi:MAG TPA: ABC transporter substrate-binding protein [Phycisphaerae bacterium]|nr:ABC transporter substrate-binding protein [Phycisphaerae bacterium]HPM23702.1 ABC transporter substrate-binding protein [Phycisphaerae bacterium]
MLIRLAHSPDPDDAFMFYGLARGAVDPGPYQFAHVLADIQTLNEEARRGTYEITAISIHAYPYVADRYALTACGSSMGDNYGPLLVSRAPLTVAELAGRAIAVPGLLTTAYLTLQLLLGRDTFRPQVLMFDTIPDAVARGVVDAGLLIHEGQLTYARQALHPVIDLGAWWHARTGLPLPLGGNAVRRDLGGARARELSGIVRASIDYGLAHRADAVDYALRFGRGLDAALADRFVGMYVNEWTRDYGPRGREAVQRLLAEGAAAGLVPPTGPLDFV